MLAEPDRVRGIVAQVSIMVSAQPGMVMPSIVLPQIHFPQI